MTMQREKNMALRLVQFNSKNVATRTVERVAEARLPTEMGEFRIIGFRSLVSAEEFVVLVKGELRARQIKPGAHPLAVHDRRRVWLNQV